MLDTSNTLVGLVLVPQGKHYTFNHIFMDGPQKWPIKAVLLGARQKQSMLGTPF